MKKLVLISSVVLSLFSLISCSSITSEKNGKVSIRTSPSTAIVKFNSLELKKGDMISLFKQNWVRQSKITIQAESLIMNGVVEKVLENNYYEVKFERNEEFSEGDKVRKI